MISYVPINSVLPLIAKSVRSEDTTPQLISHILTGYRLLESPAHTEEGVLVLQIKDHKSKLPDDIKNITLATYMGSDPVDSELTGLSGIETKTITIDLTSYSGEDNQCVGNYILSHKLFINSEYFNNNFMPMKYIGTSPYVCTNCVNRFCHACNETFSVDKNRVINTSFKDGYICLIYETEVKVDGKFQIIDDEEVKYFLARFAELEHFRDRSYSQETNALNVLDRLELKVNTWFAKAQSAIKKRLLNRQAISEIIFDRYNAKFLKHGAFVYKLNYE